MAVSLRKRLTFILLGLILLSWLVSVLAAALYAHRLVLERVDQHLQIYADMAQHSTDAILSDPYIRRYFHARSESIHADSDADLRRVRSFTGDEDTAFNLWFGGTQILVGESSPVLPRPTEEGIFTYELADGSDWRVLYRESPEFNLWRAVAVDLNAALQTSATTFWLVVLPLLIILPITVAILFFGVRRGLRPLNRLARQIATRKPHALEPFDTADVPLEMQPVVASLNDLLDRLHRALASEQRFTANAAHELQTPLAAIQAAVQSCQHRLAQAPQGNDVQPTLERISRRVANASDTVKQLLTLARLDADQRFDCQSVDLGHLIADVMADLGGLAMERNIAVKFDSSEPVRVNGNPEWLRILLSNLLLNAFRYARSASEVEVVLERRAGFVRLAISNLCEPIPPEDLQRLTERFYHPSGGTGHGVGLGLSIVQKIAELHNGELHLRMGNARFEAEVRFLK